MKWIKEIQVIGVKDWLWWVVRLRRNEFHPSLDKLSTKGTFSYRIYREGKRRRAHDIEEKLSSIV